MKIVLVDDKPNVRDSLKGMLGQLPFEYANILEAGCDLGALRLIAKHEPDIIVTDAKLLLLGEAFLNDEFLPQSKIIVTSSYKFVLKAFCKGGMDALLKPIAAEELESVMLRAGCLAGLDS